MDQNLNLNLDYILGHFQEPIFPRTISTKMTQNRQLVVYSRQEALARFAQANFLDCRISAYPPNATVNPSATERFQGLTHATPKNLVVIIDLDRSTFKSEWTLGLALARALQNIKSTLAVGPTVIWSGNGYHIYLVLDCPTNLENVKQLSDLDNQISLRFLRFTETFLSGGKSDKAHNTTVSFNNCMMRIPGSINSKNNCEVRLIQEWDGVTRPAINYLLADFCGHIANEKAQKLLAVTKARTKSKTNKITAMAKYNSWHGPGYIGWIEQLLQTPMTEHRKFAVWMILPQYLVNVRKMSHEQSTVIINDWLDECSKLRRLDCNIKQKLREGFESAQKGFGPIGHEKLKYWKPELAALLFR